MSSSNQKSVENEMISIKHRYLEIQEQLRMAEKVNSNLGKMGATKNQNLLIYTPPLKQSRNWRRNSTKRMLTKT